MNTVKRVVCAAAALLLAVALLAGCGISNADFTSDQACLRELERIYDDFVSYDLKYQEAIDDIDDEDVIASMDETNRLFGEYIDEIQTSLTELGRIPPAKGKQLAVFQQNMTQHFQILFYIAQGYIEVTRYFSSVISVYLDMQLLIEDFNQLQSYVGSVEVFIDLVPPETMKQTHVHLTRQLTLFVNALYDAVSAQNSGDYIRLESSFEVLQITLADTEQVTMEVFAYIEEVGERMGITGESIDVGLAEIETQLNELKTIYKLT